MTDKEIMEFHKVVCDPIRFNIIEYLKFHKNVTTQELIDCVHCDASTLSFHLAKLKKTKSIIITKVGKNKIYNINLSTLDNVFNFMGDVVERARENCVCTSFTKREILRTYELYADDCRIKILKLIVDHPGCTGKQIKIWTSESEANVSFHIKKLIEGNVIYARKKDNQRYYFPNIQYLACFHKFISKTKNKDVWEKNKKCDCGCE